MTDVTKLEMLKIDLGIVTDAYDERLRQDLSDAAESIQIEGITLGDSVGDGNLVIMYAAWLWRARRSGDGMPRMLRYKLNNRLFHQKMTDDEEESE